MGGGVYGCWRIKEEGEREVIRWLTQKYDVQGEYCLASALKSVC